MQNTTTENESDDFEFLKKTLQSEDWPQAVSGDLICSPTSGLEKEERGIGVIEAMIEEALTKDQKFLDFGCGEGHCVSAAASIFGCAGCVGYEIKQFNWASVPNTKITTSFNEVKSLGPYDAILLFDVLDHVEGEVAAEMLKKIGDLLAPDGSVYVRCHPWISRHGTHLFHTLNKAFAHIVFTENEITQLTGQNPSPNQAVTLPLGAYNQLFEDAKLTQLNQRRISEPLEDFFKTGKIAERILRNTKSRDFPTYQMETVFVDFHLKKGTR